MINNVGIYGSEQFSSSSLQRRLDVNLLGAVRVTEVFLSLLRKLLKGKLLFVTSSLGSITYTSDLSSRHFGPCAPGLGVSKAALNMLRAVYVHYPMMQGVRVVEVDPSFLAMIMSGEHVESLKQMGASASAVGGEAVASIVRRERDTEAGKVTGAQGANPW